MPQGAEIFRADTSLALALTDRIGRILAIESWEASALPVAAWANIPGIPAGLRVWGTIIPLFPIDALDFESKFGGIVNLDPVGRPTQIYVNATKDATAPKRLIYGYY